MDANSEIDFHTIGVAVGNGTSSMEALKWALVNENYLRRGDTVHLLHVYSPGPVRSDNAEPGTLKKFQSKRNKDVKNSINRYIKECDENEVRTEVHYGESDAVPEELVRLIRNFRITRIVIGPSKTNLLAKLTRRGGRIASYVSKHTEHDSEVVRLRHSRKGIVAAVRPIVSKWQTSPQDPALEHSLPSSARSRPPFPSFFLEDEYTPDGDGYSAIITVSGTPRKEITEALHRSHSVGKDTSTLTPSSAKPASYGRSSGINREQVDSPRSGSASQTKITGNDGDRDITEIWCRAPSELEFTTVMTRTTERTRKSTFTPSSAKPASYARSSGNNREQVDSPRSGSASQTKNTWNDQDRDITEIWRGAPSELEFTTVITRTAERTRKSNTKSTQNGLGQQIDSRGGLCQQESKSSGTPPTAGTTNSADNNGEFLNSWSEMQMQLGLTSVSLPPATGTIDMNGTWNDRHAIHSPDETQHRQDSMSNYIAPAAASTTSASSSKSNSDVPELIENLDRMQNYEDSTYAYMSLGAGTGASDVNEFLHQTGSNDNFTHYYYVPSARGKLSIASGMNMSSTWNDPQLIQQIHSGDLIVDQEAGQQANDVYYADTFVAEAERMIVECERKRCDALSEAKAAKRQWLEAALKCQKISQENETLRKDFQSKFDALTNAIEGYKGDVASAGKQVKDQRRRCKELKKRIGELSSELEKEIGRRNEAEERATKECAIKEEALAKLRRAQKKYPEYTFRELEIATHNFDEGNKLGEGGNGPVFKGKLLHTPVAVKVLTREGVHGQEEFQREVELLNNLHHPHLVMLMGACPERACIVYEYMSNGSLEDRLACKGGTPPLPWYVCFRICAEVASALLFLHSRPVPIVHRDMKPTNILLDHNFVSRIGDVGIAKLISNQELDTAIYEQEGSVLKGTITYMDPDYQRTGIVTCQSDVFALGIVMLRLLTGSRAFQVATMVEGALNKQQLPRVLDKKAGEWPLEAATHLARISLKCAEPKTRDRPDLDNEVLPILEKLRAYGDQIASKMVSGTSSSLSTLSHYCSVDTNLSSSSRSRAIFTNNPFNPGGI